MTKFAAALMAAMLLTSPALAQSGKALSSLPSDGVTVTDYYKQTVYDPSDNKIGDVADVLIGPDGRVVAFIVGVGGFLGAGEKDVAVPFNAIKGTKKNDKWYLTMSASKDDLKNAAGFKYDRASTRWVPDKK